MNVLGVSPAERKSAIGFRHDSGATIVVNGKVIASAEEERFTRVRHETRAPVNAINYCLQEANLSMQDIDAVAVPFLAVEQVRLLNALKIALLNNIGKAVFLKKLRQTLSRAKGIPYQGSLEFLHSYGKMPPVKFVEHHAAHAATAYYPSGFKKAATLTVDCSGELNSSVAWLCDNGLEKLREESFANSIGEMYSRTTDVLGFGMGGEGKTMGLAPWGKPDQATRKLVEEKVIDVEKGLWYQNQYTRYLHGKFNMQTVGFDRRVLKDEIMQPKYQNFAFEVQAALGKAMLKMAEWAIHKAGSKNLCISGGVGLNCTTNGFLLRSGVLQNLFIFPACNDGGTSFGAALEAAKEMGDKVRFKLQDMYYGPRFTDAEIEQELLKWKDKIKFSESKDIAGTVAEMVAKDQVVAWFQGRMELGPRALGNRSIISNPRSKGTLDKVNKIKRRAWWRPLAPSMLHSAANEYLEESQESPFMILAFQVKEEKRKEVPAMVHSDGSTRPQTVRKETNRLYWKLIKDFEQVTGTPIVMNTSFNINPKDRAEPIVCKPAEAIENFLKSRLDALAIGNYIVQRKKG